MKEATGELSTTVIAIVAIAAVLAIFTTILLPSLRNSINARVHCADARCDKCPDTNRQCVCYYDEYKEDGTLKRENIKINCQNPNFKSR